LFWLIQFSLAGNEAYHACCAATRAGSCPQTLEVIGPGSASILTGGRAQVTGLWRLSCESAVRFDEDRSHEAPSRSNQGTVLTPMTEAATRCFDAACHLPTSLCVDYQRGQARVAHCDAGTAPGESTWSAPTDATSAVIVDGHVVKVRPFTAANANTGRPRAPIAGSTANATPPQRGDLDLSVPPTPPTPCVAVQALRGPSNEQLDVGNDRHIQGQLSEALDYYRIAIGINQCNAFAWAALGQALLESDWSPGAQTALKTATRLMPTHFQAWTHLGECEENMRRYREARAAYMRALEVRPDFQPAVDGLARLDAR